MVDSSDDYDPSKSTAYNELAQQMWETERDITYELAYMHHHQKLMKVYSSALREGYTAEEMKSE